MTLGPLDDLMIHQTLETLDTVASDDPRWMERFWFGVCHPDGEVGLICGLGTYPNTGMVDALALVARPGEQRNLRSWRPLGDSRWTLDSPPLSFAITEPMRTWRLAAEETDVGTFSIDFSGPSAGGSVFNGTVANRSLGSDSWRQLASEGVGIIYISHRIDEVMQLSDRVTVLRDGRHVWTRPKSEIDADMVIAAMVGRNLSRVETLRREATVVEGAVLSVRDLSLSVANRRGWKQVLTGVNFDVARGEILGIGGLLGAGRTEILQTITGATNGEAGGEILIDGQPVTIRSPADARRLGIALVTEDRKTQGLHLHDTIRDNVALPLVGRLAFFGLRDFAAEAAVAADAIKTLGIRASGVEQVAATLSGGNQQKVVIGKCLATTPRILLLDEPTRGIDVGAKSDIYDLIFRLAEGGMSIVVVSSEMPELLHLSDRILVMSEGRQTGIVNRALATEERIMQLAAPRSSIRHEKTSA